MTAPSCPRCTTASHGGARYCEACGLDFTAGVTGWEVLVTADRVQFDRVGCGTAGFPDAFEPRVHALDGAQVLVGRGGTQPEVDVACVACDPGASRVHAYLVRGPDGSYALVDPGSTNGTTLNDDAAPIPCATPVKLADGDRVHIGAWTTLTIRRAY